MIAKVKKYLTIYNVLAWLWFIGCICLTGIVIFGNHQHVVENDGAHELVLGNLLAHGGGIFSDNWYYTTEVHFLDIQFIYSLLFRLTDNWAVVSALGRWIGWILIFLALFYLLKQIKLERLFPIAGGFLFIAYEPEYVWVMFNGGGYIAITAETFFVIALILSLINIEGYYKKPGFMLLLVFSVIMGMKGLRFFLVSYLPLLVVLLVRVVFRKLKYNNDCEKETLAYSNEELLALKVVLCASTATLLGLVGNSILTEEYELYEWSKMQWRYPTASALSDVIRYWIGAFGFRVGDEILAKQAIVANIWTFSVILLIIFGTVYVICSTEKFSFKERLIVEFNAMTVIIVSALFLFTTMPFNQRYFSQVAVYCSCVLAVIINKMPILKKTKLVLVGSLCVLALSTGYYNFYYNWITIFTKEYKSLEEEVADFLLENEYYNGYGFQESMASSLTELTNGKIEVWMLEDAGEKASVDNLYRWAQRRDHWTRIPEGKVFVVYLKSTYDNSPMPALMSGENMLFQNERYVVVGFDNVAAMDAFWEKKYD